MTRRQRIFRVITRTSFALLATLVLGLVTLKVLYGRGTPYPDVSGVPLVAGPDVVAVATLDFPPVTSPSRATEGSSSTCTQSRIPTASPMHSSLSWLTANRSPTPTPHRSSISASCSE
jgi:hypothetical protein